MSSPAAHPRTALCLLMRVPSPRRLQSSDLLACLKLVPPEASQVCACLHTPLAPKMLLDRLLFTLLGRFTAVAQDLSIREVLSNSRESLE